MLNMMNLGGQNFKKNTKLMNVILRTSIEIRDDLQVRIKREANKVSRHSKENFLSADDLERFCEGVIT